MSAEDLENYETDMELALYREYRDVVGLFSYVVETERRFYLANQVDLQVRSAAGEVYFELTLADAWVWDVYRSARFVKSVRVVTFKDVNVEELAKAELDLGRQRGLRPLTPARRVPTAADGACAPVPTTPGARAAHSPRGRRPAARHRRRGRLGRPRAGTVLRGGGPVRAKDAVGRYGEDVAAAHVRGRGWDVLDRNWRTPGR